MSIDDLKRLARNNFEQQIQNNVYPGRGIVLGKNDKSAWIVIYWIMGRSANSRNRIFKHENGILRTEAADPSLVEDPSLIIYNAMRDAGKQIVVTNGSQTDTAISGLEQGKSFAESLQSEMHEPDAPNYTSRISGHINLENDTSTLSILRKNPFSEDSSNHHTFQFNRMDAGFGNGVTTYMGDGNPLPAFQGEPLLLPLQGNATEILDEYWQALNADNRISLAVREITSSGSDRVEIRNRY